MVAGTSTGGIMALALALEIPAQKIEKLYREDGEQIFHQPWYWRLPWIKFLHHLRHSLYDHAVLERLLRREFGDRTLAEARPRVVVPAFMTPKTEIAVFKTDHHPDFKNDHKSKIWEIARATSAAPTYLQGHDYDGTLFLDGGVWANNPVMVALVDVLSAYDISSDQIEILSIGTGNAPFEISAHNAKRGLFRWKEVIKAAMFLTTDNAHAQAGLLIGPQRITRLEPGAEAALIELDDWAASVEILPAFASQDFEEYRENINRFFTEEAAPRERHHTTAIKTAAA